MHVQCSKTEKIGNDDIIICPICKKKEIELDIFHLNNFNINDTKYEEEKKIKKLNKDNIDIKIYRDGFIRMNAKIKKRNIYWEYITRKFMVIIINHMSNIGRQKTAILMSFIEMAFHMKKTVYFLQVINFSKKKNTQ